MDADSVCHQTLTAHTMNQYFLTYKTKTNISTPLPIIEQGITTLFHRLFPPIVGTDHKHKDDVKQNAQKQAEGIVNLVIGKRKGRLGRKPDLENTLRLKERAKKFIEAGLPIEIRLTWVPKKRILDMEESFVDLCELLSLSRLYDLFAKAQRVYRPAFHFNAFLLDLEGLFVEGDKPEVRTSMDRYIHGMRSLVSAIGLDSIFSVICISDTGSEREKRLWMRQMEENFKKLKAYWVESEKKGIEGYETYQSYKELLAIRWKGCIHQKTRDYHLKQLNSLGEDIVLEEKIDMLIRSFSASLLHHQFMILKTPGVFSPLNISFIPPVPMIPPHLMKARINLRPMPSGLSRVSCPPWSAKGLITVQEREVKPLTVGWGELRHFEAGIIPGIIHINKGNKAAQFKADLYSV